MGGKHQFLGLLVVASNFYTVFGKPDKTVMKDVTIGFGKALEACREESGLTAELMEEFVHFWRDDVEHVEFGCAIFCMARTLNLLNENHRLHHDNMDAFVKSFPQGELIAKKIVDLIHNCEVQNDQVEDNCRRFLVNAKCFRSNAELAGLAPTSDMLATVIL